jgi:hypothetical protein
MDALGMGLGVTADRLIRARAARRSLGDSASPKEYEAIDTDLNDGADPYGDRATKEVQTRDLSAYALGIRQLQESGIAVDEQQVREQTGLRAPGDA